MRTSLRVVFVTALTIVGAPAASAQKKGCDTVATKIVTAVGAPVYRECDVDKKAEQPRTSKSPFTPSRMDRSCIRAEVEVAVDYRGTPVMATARVLRTDDEELGKAALEDLAAMHYKPAVKDGQPVAVLTTYKRSVTIQIPGAGNRGAAC